MGGSGNPTTIRGKQNQALGVLALIGGLFWWFGGSDIGDSMGPLVMLAGVGLLVWGKFQEWLGR